MKELLAPNGKPSNLTPEQYELVRKPEFKAWFGDWENEPENASKVVDENGEPLVCYHGTGASFYTFEKTNFGKLGKGMYFTSFFNDAKKYANRYNGGIVLEVFLNSKQLAIISNPFAKNELPEQYDGVWAFKGGEGGEEIVVFEPTQIKLSDGTNTIFNGNNPDIRFDDGGEIKRKIIYPNTQSAYDLQAQKFIVDFLKKSKIKQLVKNSDDKGNYEIYVVYDKLYPNESKFYITDSIQKAYDTALNLDVAELNIVKAKNDKDSNTLVYDYYNGDLFGNYLGEKYDEKGNLKQEVKSEAINQMNKHFNRDWYSDGGEIIDIMKNEIIDILSKNARYKEEIFSIQDIGRDVINKCIESNTYFGDAIEQANDNYLMITVGYEDKLFAIDKKLEYVYFSKPNKNTSLKVEYKYDLKEYPFPVLFDSELINNEEFHDINEYEEIKSSDFDSEYLYRGINSAEMESIMENGFIKSNASLNIGEQQSNTTSFAQHISQAGSYAVGFNAWYDEVTFAKPKYVLKVKKEGLEYTPTNEGDLKGEVDVYGEINSENIECVYEIKLGECGMGNVEINVGYKGDFSEGSRFPMRKKVFVRKIDYDTLFQKNDLQNKNEINNDMTNSNPKDTITMDIPLLIRFAELMREDIKTDVELHQVIENTLNLKDKSVLTMDDYNSIVGNVIKPEEEKMEQGGKVQLIHSKKGDIKISLGENWYSDDTDVELVPVSELIKFREFNRKVNPKYNQDDSNDNINHLAYKFKEEGVKSPLIIEYSPDYNSVLLIEGNHRISSASDLDMEYLPARVVLKKYGKYSKEQLKNIMKVSGFKADKSGYIPSNLKPSQVGIKGAKPIIYAEGGIIEGRLHSECGEDGCGRKFQVGENGHEIEAERDEAVIVADAFDSNEELKIKGTPSEIASALNVIGGGKSFDAGAEVEKDGEKIEHPELKKEATNTDVDDVIDSGSVIINRRSMVDDKEYEVTGTPKQIASAINSIDGNGVVIEEGAEIKEN